MANGLTNSINQFNKKKQEETAARQAAASSSRSQLVNQNAQANENNFATATLTTSSGKQYTLDRNQFDWIRNRYRNDWADTYGYDEADQRAKAAGQMSAKVYSSYNQKSALDSELRNLGLPSEKNLDKYLGQYAQWHTGGIADVFGDSVSPAAWTKMKELYKQDWTYDTTAEDQARKARGLMPSALEAKYDDTEIDDQLKASGLPSMKEASKYFGQYNNYVGIDSLYKNVARDWTNLRLQGIKNDGKEYPNEDGTVAKTGAEWYADAFFDELMRQENGKDVYGEIKPLFKNRTSASSEVDPSKDYVTERGKLVTAGNKADALDSDYAKYNAFSYDDFDAHYQDYYDRYIKDAQLTNGQTVEKALSVLARKEDEQAEKEFYTVPGKKDVEDFVFRYNADDPTATPEKMFTDMYEHGLSDKLVNQAKKILQDQPGADKKAIADAYSAAKVSSGELQKQQEAIWDTINADPHDVPVGVNEEKENNAKRVRAGTKSLELYIDNAIKEGADAETVQLATDAIERAISRYMDPDEGTISPDDVINILNGISEQPWNNATAMRLALEDYGFGENGELTGPAADLTAGWDARDIRKVVNSIGSVRYNGIELSDETLDRLNNSMNSEISDDEAYYSRGANGQLDYERFMHAIDWANEQIQTGAMNEFDAYNILNAEGFQDEIKAYMPDDWYKALFAHERVKEAYEAAGGDQLAWYEGLTDEEKYQHGLDIWSQLPDEEKAKMFQDYDWKYDPAVYRTGGQAWAQQFSAIIPQFATNLVSGAVKLADMMDANLTGREELWDITQDLMGVENKLASYGAVNDSLGNGAQLASTAADAVQEVARMYLFGTIGGTIGHGTKLGQALAETAGNEAAKQGVKAISKFGLTMMTSSPFVVNAAAGNFAEAKLMGATTGEATAYGLLTGTLEGVLESLNFDELWGKVLGEGAFGQMIMDGGAAFRNMGVVAKARIANMVASGLGEFSEETVSYLAETLWKTHASWGGDTKWDLNDWIQQAGMGFLTGMLGSGLSSGNITKESILYEYWKSNPETRSALLNTEVGRTIWEQASDTQKAAWRNGDTKVLSIDAFADLVTQMSILDNAPAKALDDYNRTIANINKKAENARAEAAAKFSKNSVERDGASATRAATAYANMTVEDALAAASRYEARVTYENTVNNARAQLQVLQRQFSEHYAALYLQNESNIATRNVNGITANVSRDVQNGATVTPESRAEASGPVGVLQDNEETSNAAEPTVASIREAAYNRVYKDQEIGKNAAGEASGPDAKGMTRVEFADSERNNFQAKTTAKLRRVTLELAGLEAKEGMSAKEIFAEAKKAMTPEAAQKLDVYTRISKALGLDMVIRDVVTGTSGYVQDGKLYVTLNGKQNLLRVTAHELTHYMKDHVRGGYENLRTHLISEVGGQGAFDQMVSEKAGEYGYDLNTEDGRVAADDEVCAELCEKMLENKDALARFVDKDMSAAQKFKARLGRTLVAIKSAIRSLGTSNTETRGDLIKEQDTIELWYKTLSDAIDSANAQGKAKATPAAETAAETTATTGEAAPQAPPAPETNADLFIGEESARREQLRSELEKLAERGTRVNGMQYQEVNDILDRAIFGDRSNYNKADYAQIRGMLAQLIPEVQAMVNEDANVDLDTLNERVSTAIDYMLSRYHEGSEDLYNLRELIPNKIALSETAYNDLRAKDMTLRQASRELSSALGKFVSFVYKKSPGYNTAATIDEVWRDIGYDPDGVGNIAEDANALIDYVKERSGQSAFDDLYRSQREDIVAAQVGEFLDAVQSMAEGKNAEQDNVRHMADSEDYSDRPIVDLSEDTRLPGIVSGLKGAQKYKAIQKYILDELAGLPIHFNDGTDAVVDKSDASHMASGAGDKKTAEIDKIKEVIENAELYATDDNAEHNKFNAFKYYESIVKFGNETFPIYLNVGRAMNDGSYHLYDITHNIRESAGRINGLERAGGLRSANGFSDTDIMPETNPIVKSSTEHSLDDDYMPLAERYDAGIATEEETEELQADVLNAAKEAMPNTKIVDENGNPRVVYHGTSERFTVFDRTKGRSTMDIQGMFFSPWEIEASGYGENVGSYYLNIQNPAPESVAYSALRRFQGQNNAGTKAMEYLANLGYDGVNNEYDEYIAFYPDQIKSADLVTYDDDNNIIPLSERFDQNKVDTRWSVDDDWDALIQQYGAKPQGREPRASDIRVPNRVNDKTRVSDFGKSLMESEHMTNDMREEGKRLMLEQNWMSYEPKSDDKSMTEARSWIAARQPAQAQQEFHDMVMQGKFGSKTNAIGLQLLTEASERGDVDSFFSIATDLQMATTDAGRAVQILNVLKELKGVGSAYYMQRYVERLNNQYDDQIQSGKMQPITVPQELMDQLARAKTVDEINAAEDAVGKEIARQLPLTWKARLNNWRHLSMLGSPLTQFRNLAGNLTMMGTNAAKGIVAPAVQRVAEFAGLANESDRTHALLSSADKSYWETFAEQSYKEQQRHLSGTDKFGVKSSTNQYMRMFDTKWLNALAKGSENGKNVLTKNGILGMLNVVDDMFIKPQYKAALKQYMKAQGYTLNAEGEAGKVNSKGEWMAMTKGEKAEAEEWSTQQAWKATFHDASDLADTLNKLSNKGLGWNIFIEGVMPYKKTPINIAKRGFEYSPGGIIMGTVQLLTSVKNGKMSAAQAIDNIASGITGTALMTVGMFLAKAGLIRAGGEDKKKYETYLEDTGDQKFALKFGDYSIDLSSLSPASIPLFMGVALQERIDNGDWSSLELSDIADVFAGALNPFMEMSFMSSLNSALQNYSNGGIAGAVGGTVKTIAQNYVSQYLPTLGSKVAQFIDPTRRTTKSSAASPLGGSMDYYVRSLMKKVPGVASTLQPDVDVWGRTDTKDAFGEWALDFANKFFLPTQVKVSNRDSVDRELIRVVESTGVVDFLPSDGNKYFTVNGNRFNMNAKQYAQYSQDRGQAAYAAIKDVMSSAAYRNASDEERANMLTKAKDAAYKQVNNIWKDKLGAFDR